MSFKPIFFWSIAALLLALLSIPQLGRVIVPQPIRKAYFELLINWHAGFAHFSRGMNLNTIESLRKAVTPADLPILEDMLSDADSVTRMTAANVLARMGPSGQTVLNKSASTEALEVLNNIEGIQEEVKINSLSKQAQNELSEISVSINSLRSHSEDKFYATDLLRFINVKTATVVIKSNQTNPSQNASHHNQLGVEVTIQNHTAYPLSRIDLQVTILQKPNRQALASPKPIVAKKTITLFADGDKLPLTPRDCNTICKTYLGSDPALALHEGQELSFYYPMATTPLQDPSEYEVEIVAVGAAGVANAEGGVSLSTQEQAEMDQLIRRRNQILHGITSN